MTMAATKKSPKKIAKKQGYRPLVLERYAPFGLPHRLVVRQDGELEVQHRSYNNTWHRDEFAHADVAIPAQGCFPDV